VQLQRGHGPIALTVDRCGKWLPMADKGAVDALANAAWGVNGSKCKRHARIRTGAVVSPRVESLNPKQHRERMNRSGCDRKWDDCVA